MNPAKEDILIVDDEEASLRLFSRCFNEGYNVHTALSVDEAIQVVEQHQKIKVVICDQRLPGKTGVQFFSVIKERFPRVVRILSTAYSDYDLLIESINAARVFAYLDKPWNIPMVNSVIENAVAYYYSSGENSAEFQISRPDPVTRREISISAENIDHLQTVLHLVKQRIAVGNASSVKISQFGQETVLSLGKSGSEEFELVSLSDVQGLLGGGAISERDLLGNLQDLTGARLPVARSSMVGNFEEQISPERGSDLDSLSSSVTLQAAGGGDAFQIRSSLDQIQIYLTSMINIIGSGKGTGMSSGIKKLSGNLLNIRSMCRSASAGDAIVGDGLKSIMTDLLGFLDGLNSEGTVERKMLQKFSPEYQTINGLFMNYNNLAVHCNCPVVRPDSSLISLVKESQAKLDKGLIWFGMAIVVVPVLMALFYSAKEDGLRPYDAILRFAFLVILSLISGIVAGVISGRASVSGVFEGTAFNEKPMLAKATGGLAVFFIVLVLGVVFAR